VAGGENERRAGGGDLGESCRVWSGADGRRSPCAESDVPRDAGVPDQRPLCRSRRGVNDVFY
jgi:hypothetical protein